jgi:hypothetical protein
MRDEQVHSFNKGLKTDIAILNFGDGMYYDLLNGQLVTGGSDEFILQKRKGTVQKAQLSQGFIPMGVRTYNNVAYIVSGEFDSGGNFMRGEVGTYPSPDWSLLNATIPNVGAIDLQNITVGTNYSISINTNDLGDSGSVTITLAVELEGNPIFPGLVYNFSAPLGITVTPSTVTLLGTTTVILTLSNVDLSNHFNAPVIITVITSQLLNVLPNVLTAEYVFNPDTYSRPRVPLLDAYSPLHNFRDTASSDERSYKLPFTTSKFSFELYSLIVEFELQADFDRSINMIFTDGQQPVRCINSRMIVFEDDTVILADRAGTKKDSNVYDNDSFYKTELILKNNKIPTLKFKGFEDGGNSEYGGYKFFFRYSNELRNSTDVIQESGLVQVLNSSGVYYGDKEPNRSSQSIRFDLSDLNQNYAFVTVQVAYYSGTTEDLPAKYYQINKLYSLDARRFNTMRIVITGYEEITLIDQSSIGLELSRIDTVKTMTQYNDRLLLANIKTKRFNLYETFVNLTSQLVIRESYEIVDKNFYHNPVNCYHKTGAWRGETYELAFCWILNDGSTLPPIPVRGLDNLNTIGPEVYNNAGTGFNNFTGENPQGVYRTRAVNSRFVPLQEDFPDLYRAVFNGNEVVTEISVKYLYIEDNLNAVFNNPIIRDNTIGYFVVKRKRLPDALFQGVLASALPVSADRALDIPDYEDNGGSQGSGKESQVAKSITTIQQKELIGFVNTSGNLFNIHYSSTQNTALTKFIGSLPLSTANTPFPSLASSLHDSTNSYTAFPGTYWSNYTQNSIVVLIASGGSNITVPANSVVYVTTLMTISASTTAGNFTFAAINSSRTYSNPFLGSQNYYINPESKTLNFVPHVGNLYQLNFSFNKLDSYNPFLTFVQAPSLLDAISLVNEKGSPVDMNSLSGKSKYTLYTSDLVTNSARLNARLRNRRGSLAIGQSLTYRKYEQYRNAPIILMADITSGNLSIPHPLHVANPNVQNKSATLDYINEFVDNTSQNAFTALVDRGGRFMYPWYSSASSPTFDYSPFSYQYGNYIGVEFPNNGIRLFQAYQQTPVQKITKDAGIPGFGIGNYGDANNFQLGYIVNYYDNSYGGPLSRSSWANKYRDNVSPEYNACTHYTSWTEHDRKANKLVTANLYMGDCYISPSYKRIFYNIGIPESPQVSASGYLDYKRADRGFGLMPQGLAIELIHESSYNAAFRSLENAEPVEKLIYGTDRSFYPVQAANEVATKAQFESKEYNFGYVRQNYPTAKVRLDPSVPYQSDIFDNRVLASPKSNGLVTNNYRNFAELNFRDYARELGSITKILSLNQYVYLIFEHGIAILPIDEQNLFNTESGQVTINTGEILSNKLFYLNEEFGSTQNTAVKRGATFIYGYDFIKNRVWQVNRKGFQLISVFAVQDYFNKMKETLQNTLEFNPIIFTNFEENLDDISFTVQNKNYSNRPTALNSELKSIHYNELLAIWVTKTDLNHKFTFSLNGHDYVFSHQTEPNGIYQLNSDAVSRSNFYNNQYNFEVEIVLNKNTRVQKIFNNLKIISNSVPPDVIKYAVMEARLNRMTNEQRPTKYEENIYPREKGFGIVEANSEYVEDHHWVEVLKPTNRLNDVTSLIETSEEKIRDKAIRIRLIYTGGEQTVIQGIISMFNYSYS